MLQTPSKTTQTLLSPRIPRDNEHERYHPELEEELKECLFCLQRNAMMFDLEVDSDLIEQRIYERQGPIRHPLWSRLPKARTPMFLSFCTQELPLCLQRVRSSIATRRF